MMFKSQGKFGKNVKKSRVAFGVILALTLIGAGGCGSNTTAATSSTSTSSTSATTTASTQQAQGQTARGQLFNNPAIRAAMDIRRLENNQQAALTSDQKTKLKPILQTLINTANPSQDFLQKEADAINAVFTTQQKSLLTQRRPPQGNNQNGNTPSGTSQSGTKANTSNPQHRTRNNQNGQAMQPKDIYQQVLNSLN